MPKVRVNYDGWIALPPAVRQKLKLGTGDQLDLELSGETVTLRRSEAAPASRVPEPSPVPAAEASPSEPSPAAEPEPVAKRGPGRPRKVSASVALPSGKARGSRRINAASDQEVQ